MLSTRQRTSRTRKRTFTSQYDTNEAVAALYCLVGTCSLGYGPELIILILRETLRGSANYNTCHEYNLILLLTFFSHY
jgi:hypothetical protein